MRQNVQTVNVVDSDGYPAGGTVRGTGLHIDWQNGPLGTGEERLLPNGAFVEDVLQACLERIRFYQDAADGKFRCRENALAITHIEDALFRLDDRTRQRQARGVEGTHSQ